MNARTTRPRIIARPIPGTHNRANAATLAMILRIWDDMTPGERNAWVARGEIRDTRAGRILHRFIDPAAADPITH